MSVDEINTALSASRASRSARRRVNNMLDAKLVSPQAMQWLLSAVDPFCDEELTVTGFPTTRQSRSVPQMVTRTYNLSRPASVTEGDNWDAVVLFLPAFITGSDYRMTPCTITSSLVSSRSGPDLYSGVSVLAGAEDMNWHGITTGTWSNAVALPDDYQQDEFRLTACAFEVVNTTAPLHKQGSVTIARVANGKALTSVNVASAMAPLYSTGQSLMVPPGTQEELALYPGSRTWAAEKGAYVIATLSDPENPTIRNVPSEIYMTPNQGPPPASTALRSWRTLPGVASHVADWDENVAHFAGLSSETTLQVTVRYYIERFPSPASSLVVMAQKPCPYDALILQMYALGLRDFCCAVPQGENPLGEWLNMVLDAIGYAAPAIGSVIGGLTGQPELALLGQAAGLSAKALRNRRRRQAEARAKPKNEPQKTIARKPNERRKRN
jgi:hypothetical protein